MKSTKVVYVAILVAILFCQPLAAHDDELRRAIREVQREGVDTIEAVRDAALQMQEVTEEFRIVERQMLDVLNMLQGTEAWSEQAIQIINFREAHG